MVKGKRAVTMYRMLMVLGTFHCKDGSRLYMCSSLR
uniref:Uncharacterized protein n=1 Tax=Anguilla anguilla TaxID=7936 RepID=A0A0E9PJI3_ANGAN